MIASIGLFDIYRSTLSDWDMAKFIKENLLAVGGISSNGVDYLKSFNIVLMTNDEIDFTNNGLILPFENFISSNQNLQNGDITIYGNDNDNTINGGSDNAYINGEGGDDFILGGYGKNHLLGGDGNDTMGSASTSSSDSSQASVKYM